MPGRAPKEKGARFERAVVEALKGFGISSQRVPDSGSSRGAFGGDLVVHVAGGSVLLECKKRAGGFKRLYTWLGAYYGLVIGADRAIPLVVIRFEDFGELLSLANKAKTVESEEQKT